MVQLTIEDNEERTAYYRKNNEQHERNFIIEYRRKISEEAKTKNLYYKYTGKEEYFQKIITLNAAIVCRKQDGGYELNSFI